ncbi:MAG: tetratricopeptide repeat protein [Chloroflexota bacterium]|nr:MAG: tetratricopeptide repeat protein [Chloroflexota bacterium]
MASLRVALSNLKKNLGTFLTITSTAAGINSSADTWLDVTVLEAHLESVDKQNERLGPSIVNRIEEGLEIYRGEFLQGFHLSDCREFEDWVIVERQRLMSRVVDALSKLSAWYLERGEYEAGISHTRRLTQMDPLLEEAHQLLMQLFAYSGQRSAALAQFEILRQALEEELGLEPDARSRGLYDQIEAGSLAKPTPAAAIKMSLPPMSTIFVGRRDELADIQRLLNDPACRMLTLTGPGGSGKTTLAIRAAREAAEAFPNGVFFVALEALDSTEFLVSSIVEGIRLDMHGTENQTSQLLNYLRDKEILLVMDNFENLLDGASFLPKILGHAPGVKILTTSRLALRLREEWLFSLEGLDFPVNGSLENIESYSAVRLFVERARQMRPDFVLAGHESSVSRICHLVDGIPLGIELAAGWVRTLSCQSIVREIQQNLDFLSTELRDVPERHQTIRAVFEQTWRLLTDDEQDAFMRLSIFRGGLRRQEALIVGGVSDRTVMALADKSLLRRDSTQRYQLHVLLRQFAEERLQQNRETYDEVRSLHSRVYADFLGRRLDDLQGGRQRQAIEEITVEIKNIRRGWRWAVEQWHEAEISEYLESLFMYYESKGWFEEGARIFGRGTERVERVESLPEDVSGASSGYEHVTAGLLSRRGALLITLGEFDEAQRLLEQALELATRHEMTQEIAFCTFQMGNMARMRGDYDEAKRHLKQSIALSGELGDMSYLGRALNQLGIVVASLGEFGQARQLFQESISSFRSANNQWGAAKPINNLGVVFYYLKQYREARQLYAESLEINRATGDLYGIAISLNNLGVVSHGMNDLNEARKLHEESLRIFFEIGYSLGAGNCLKDLGKVDLDLNDLQAAGDHFYHALQIAANLQAVPLGVLAIVGIASLLAKQGQPERALKLLNHVAENPAADQEAKDSAQVLRVRLDAQLPQEVRVAAEESDIDLVYEDVVQELLNEYITRAKQPLAW